MDDKEIKTNTSAIRAQWGKSIEFLMSCIAMSVGYGNVWRFPFTAYSNGGGAFLIPYLIILTFIGRPLYYMEMALGQFSGRGNVEFYTSLSPYLRGVGYAQVITVLGVATYYCSLMAVTLFYFINSFTGDLPWANCWNEWEPYLNATGQQCVAAVDALGKKAAKTISSSELYFTQEVLKEKTDISDGIGYPEWRLTLCLLFSWILTFLVSVKGIRSSGKVSYFLAIFPYVILFVLLIRAATLEGSGEGMYYFIKTDWSKLASAKVWYAAVTQCFFSLNVGFGSIIMFASYNNFNHNINRDALIVSTLDTFTSLLAGVTIFGILGNLAHNLGVTPDRVVNSGGTGLAFISYPDAIAKMNVVPWLFAILFFFMLYILGLGSLAALHATMNTVLQDIFPKMKAWQVSGCTAAAGFLIGLVYVTPGGQFILNLVDYFAGTFNVFIFIIIEVTSVSWLYGLSNFCLDLQFMLNKKVHIYWKLTWGLITPAILIAILIFFLATFANPTYGTYPFPKIVIAFGWAVLALSLIQYCFWIAYFIFKHRQFGFPKMVQKAFSYENWGPRTTEHNDDWRKFKNEALQRVSLQHRSILRKCFDSLHGR